MNETICIINVYFGNFPNYFALWIKSCEYNPTIDFLLLTDQQISYKLPSNIHLIPYSLKQMQKEATNILGFNAKLNTPYKCCDYRAMYGLLFSKYLEKYDYWGYCDTDMLFGDIRYFLNNYKLKNYDKFLALGHLSLYKNIKQVNECFMLNGASYEYKEINYIDVFSNDKNYCFDELSGIYDIMKKNNFKIFVKNIFADISHLFKRYRIVQNFYYLDPIEPNNYKYQIFYWENGKVKRAYYKHGKIYTEEYIYIHFKKRPNFNINFDEKMTDSFYITHNGFYPKTTIVSKQVIIDLVPYSILQDKIMFVMNMIRDYKIKLKCNIKRVIYLLLNKK